MASSWVFWNDRSRLLPVAQAASGFDRRTAVAAGRRVAGYAFSIEFFMHKSLND
jgi:hypothetical protein